jgi:hypothetical protein
LQDAEVICIDKLRSGWKNSKNQGWKTNAKSINLFEHYYNQPMRDDQIQACKTKVLTCIRNFYNSPIKEKITKLKKDDWISLEDFQNFKMNDGSEVSLKIDLGFKHDGKVYLIDFKTGKQNNAVIEQLTVYGMYCLKKGFAKKLSDIVIVPIYLMSDNLIELGVTKQQILGQAEIINNESKILAKAHKHIDNEEYFEMTDDVSKCKYCQFKEICPGSKR